MKENMTKGNPLSIILRFTIPLFIGNLFQQIYNTIDTMIVGQYLGKNALAAVGSTGTLMFMIIGLALGLCTGFTVLTSQKFGEENESETRQSVANGTLLSIIIIVVMTALSLVLLPTLLHLMNTPEDIYDDAYTYIKIICIGIFANVAYNYLASCLRAIGNSKLPLYTLVFSAILNIILDLFFIRNLNMGVAGAALATVIAQGVSALMCLLYILSKEPLLKPSAKMFHFRSDFTKIQLAVGIPMALQFGITGSGTVIMQSAINLFGATAVAAYSASSKVTNLLMQGAVSLGQTMATYAGQNYGAHEIKRIKQGVRCALIIDVIYSVAAYILVNAGLPLFMKLFFNADTDMTEMMRYARQYISICTAFYIPLSVIFTFRNTMQGCGYGFLPMMGGVVELIARLLFAVMAMQTLNYTLACFCDPAAWLAAGVFTMFAYLYVMKKICRSQRADL